ncbi:hypothetical protein SFUMM280S_11507 [Streptomyces fumanus]
MQGVHDGVEVVVGGGHVDVIWMAWASRGAGRHDGEAVGEQAWTSWVPVAAVAMTAAVNIAA